MSDLTRIATRLFGTPLLMDRAQLDVILGVLGPRLGLPAMPAPKAMDQEDESRARQERRPYQVTSSGVAIVPILGALVARAGQVQPDCTELRSYASIGRDLEAAQRDPQVRGIVLDIDSPGGEAANVMEFAGRIAAMRGGKPIIAAINPGAYSAAYAIASAADRIVIPRTGGVGSVGVVALHVDRSGEDEKIGHRYTWIAAGDRKLDGNPHAPLTDAAEAVIRAEVDRLYGIFTELVAANRAAQGLTLAAVRASEAGLFFGENAVAAKFADVVGTIDDAVAMAAGADSTGRGRPSARNPNSRGAKMEDQNPAGDAQANTNPNPSSTPPVDMAAIQAQARQAMQAQAAEIAALCELAGVPARAAGFIAEGKSPAEARATLLAEKAEAAKQGGEIQSGRPLAAPNVATSASASVMAGWDRAGRNVFGDKWKGI